MQKNLTDTFNELELFNYLTIYSHSQRGRRAETPQDPNTHKQAGPRTPVLDDEFLRKLAKTKGVEWALPEIRFPAEIKFGGREKFSLIRVLPAGLCRGGFVKLRAGGFYTSDDENSLIISDSLLRRLGVKKPETVIGRQIEISTLTTDFSLSNLPNVVSFFRGTGLPLATRSYKFTIVGVAERMGMTGPVPIRSDVFMPYGTSRRMKKISLTSVSDMFQLAKPSQGYSVVTLKLTSPTYVEAVKTQMEKLGFETFAMADQIREIKTGFLFVDMVLLAVGMIGVTVAALGIVNTMVMSIMERYREIGIMKAVGASDGDVKKIFLFESGVIGFVGGIFGLALGWLVSTLIDLIVNTLTVRQGVPYMHYFTFPLWLCLGAIGFSILVSLLAGVYPTLRAARIDPVVALRHD
jgi:putative ABC transport system permease protein